MVVFCTFTNLIEQVYDVAETQREKAIVVAVLKKGANPQVGKEHLEELELLLDTAGADVVAKLTQERVRPDFATAIGKVK